jgi:hypothetical protein
MLKNNFELLKHIFEKQLFDWGLDWIILGEKIMRIWNGQV